MFFNPLFISNASSANTNDSAKEGKFSNSNYLFANIINLSQEKLTSIEPNIKIDEKNQTLFNNLVGSSKFADSKKANPNQFISDATKLSTFISNILERKVIANTSQSGNNSEDLAVIPEQIIQIMNSLSAGEKISIPIVNNGKNIFVEVQKFDSGDTDNTTSTKKITLTNTQLSDLQFSDLNFKKIVSEISNSLHASIAPSNGNINETKIDAIVEEIQKSFSNLVAINNDSFQPQKNLLGSLVNDIEKKFDLTAAESSTIKNVIVAEFVKQINESVTSNKTGGSDASDKNTFVPVNDLSSTLSLNTKEKAIVSSLKAGRINISEFANQLEHEISKPGKSTALNSLLAKLRNNFPNETNLTNINAQQTNLQVNDVASILNLTTKEVEVVNKLAGSKISIPELSSELKIEAAKPSATSELKSVVQKLNKFIALNKTELQANPTEKIQVSEVASKLNLTTKEVEVVNKLVGSKISIPELSSEIKIEAAKPSATPELKSVIQKLDKFIALNKTELQAKPTEKLQVSEVAIKLNLTTKEIEVVNKLAANKISIPELNSELKIEAVKPTATPELKSVVQKLDKFIALNKTGLQAKHIEKLNVSEIVNKLNLTTKEIEVVNNLAANKISIPELNSELKIEAAKPSATPELKSVVQKLDKFIAVYKTELQANPIEKLKVSDVANKLNLTTKEVDVVNKLATNKFSIPELSSELKIEAAKPSATPELKSVVQKLDKFIALNKTELQAKHIEKLNVSEIVNKLNLTTKEIEVVNKLAANRISIPELSSELKIEAVKPTATPELKSVVQKLDEFITLNKTELHVNPDSTTKTSDLSKTLKLNPAEHELVNKLKVEKINISELEQLLKTEVVKNPAKTELKSLLTKLAIYENSINVDNTKISGVSIKKGVGEVNIADKAKATPQNTILPSETSKAQSDILKSEFLFTLKNEKSSDSLLVDTKIQTEKNSPELLKTSIYASKESAEFTKLKVVPLNDDAVKRNDFRQSDDNFKKSITQKLASEIQHIGKSNEENKSSFNNNSSNTQNANNANISSVSSEKIFNDSLKKEFSKEMQSSNEAVANEENKIKNESNVNTRQNNSDTKAHDNSLTRASFVGHQIRNQSMLVNEKIIYKQIDIKSFKEEISNLMLKGEKKTVEFQLTPENLGKLQIKLEVINKVVSASIKVDNEMTQQIVQQSMEGLKSTLNQNGVLYNSLNVSLSESEDKNNRYFKQKRKNGNEIDINIPEVEEKFVHKKLGYNKYDFIA